MRIQFFKVLLLCCIGALLVQCSDMKSLPPEMVGKWTTDDPSHEGQFLDISPTAFMNGTEGEESFSYSITKVKTEKGTLYKSTLYIVYCIDTSGEENIFTFIYTPEQGGIVRYKAFQDILWRRSVK